MKALRDSGREIGIGLILVAIPSLITWVLPGGWATIWNWIKNTWTWLGASGSLPHWIIIILWLSLALLAAGILLIGWLKLREKHDAVEYVGDTVFGVYWRWRWSQHGIQDLYPFCPKCDFQIQPLGGYSYIVPGTIYQCDNPDCGRFRKEFEQNQSEIQDLVTRKIQQDLRKRFGNGQTKTA